MTRLELTWVGLFAALSLPISPQCGFRVSSTALQQDIPGLNPHSNLCGRMFSLNGNMALCSPLTAQQETGSLVPDTPAKPIEPGIRDAGPSRNEESKNKYFQWNRTELSLELWWKTAQWFMIQK